MARGEMVRFLAENEIMDVKHIREFKGLEFTYSEELSDEKNYVFVRGNI